MNLQRGLMPAAIVAWTLFIATCLSGPLATAAPILPTNLPTSHMLQCKVGWPQVPMVTLEEPQVCAPPSSPGADGGNGGETRGPGGGASKRSLHIECTVHALGSQQSCTAELATRSEIYTAYLEGPEDGAGIMMETWDGETKVSTWTHCFSSGADSSERASLWVTKMRVTVYSCDGQDPVGEYLGGLYGYPDGQ